MPLFSIILHSFGRDTSEKVWTEFFYYVSAVIYIYPLYKIVHSSYFLKNIYNKIWNCILDYSPLLNTIKMIIFIFFFIIFIIFFSVTPVIVSVTGWLTCMCMSAVFLSCFPSLFFFWLPWCSRQVCDMPLKTPGAADLWPLMGAALYASAFWVGTLFPSFCSTTASWHRFPSLPSCTPEGRVWCLD